MNGRERYTEFIGGILQTHGQRLHSTIYGGSTVWQVIGVKWLFLTGADLIEPEKNLDDGEKAGREVTALFVKANLVSEKSKRQLAPLRFVEGGNDKGLH